MCSIESEQTDVDDLKKKMMHGFNESENPTEMICKHIKREIFESLSIKPTSFEELVGSAERDGE